MKQETVTFWQAEADEVLGPSPHKAPRFPTREEAEVEARTKGYAFVARYRGTPGEIIRRAYPVRAAT